MNKYRKRGKRVINQKAKYQILFDSNMDVEFQNQYIQYFNRMIISSVSVGVPSGITIKPL